MKQIGKEVCFLKTGIKNPRNGECSFLRLRDGRIMCVYTKYYGDDWTDHAIARLEAIYSSDEGESWSESSILIEKDKEALIERLSAEMKDAARRLEFEQAAFLRDKIRELRETK